MNIMDVRSLILEKIARNKEIKAVDIIKATGFSRAYIDRFFKELRDEGKIILIGKANQAHYVIASKKAVSRAKRKLLNAYRILENKNLSEDIVLEEIKRETGIFLNLPKNVSDILDYAFLEMLNNAIEHSNSKKIIVIVKRDKSGIYFEIIDQGIGIFKNIMEKRNLKNELEAIQDLLKGKQTTKPEEHTGEGIFFTSKVTDRLIIKSSIKELIFDNRLKDVFIRDIKLIKGTKVRFEISKKSKRELNKIFEEYAGQSYEFSKTKVAVNLYKMDKAYISRSQARRVMAGLDKFKTIILNFKDVETIGQAFADEVFRVWQRKHPQIKINYINCNENVDFIIKHVLGEKL